MSAVLTAYGPTVPFCSETHAKKYRSDGESFPQAMHRVASTLSDNSLHQYAFEDALMNMRFMPGGRIQAAIGSPKNLCGFNCFVLPIEDSFVDGDNSIMDAARKSAATMRMGGGVGYDFSKLRPYGDIIQKLQSRSSGPVSFMEIFDAVCRCTSSGGHRRGSQMAVLRCDHPDILTFVRSKHNENKFTGFNISVGITDAFMTAVDADAEFPLQFEGKVYKTIPARELWDEIMRSTWDWAEPGVLFIDRINEMNNLWYCEDISATNPCLAAGSLVSTPHGYVPVESVQPGDKIMAIDGIQSVTSVEKHANVPVYLVEFTDGTRLRATAAHIFHIRSNENKKWNKDTRLEDIESGQKVRTSYVPFHNDVKYDKSVYSDGLLNGALLGDGCLVKRTNGAVLSFGKHEKSWQDAFVNECRQWCGSVYADKTANSLGILRAAPIKVPRCKGPDKYIPLDLINGDACWVSGLVDGYFSTDGNVHMNPANPQIRASSRSRELLTGIKLILGRFGIHAKVYRSKKTDTTIGGRTLKFTGPVWQLSILGENILRFASVFKLTHPDRERKLRCLVSEFCLSGDTHTTSIRSIAPDGVSDVYDIYADVTDTWITEGIVNRGCGEQPLPAFGACLLGSFNLAKYIYQENDHYYFNSTQLIRDIPHAVRALDNVFERTSYPLTEQRDEALSKRRMGIGVTGLANAAEAMGMPYGGQYFVQWQAQVLRIITNECYKASARLAQEKGTFPLYDAEKYMQGKFVQTLDKTTREYIRQFGIRNSHLTSEAPTGTISFCADNVSSGIEPVFDYDFSRTVIEFDGPRTETIQDYGVSKFGVYGKRTRDVTIQEHLDVLCTAQRFMDSAVSKTCNIPSSMAFDEFQNVYTQAWRGGAKGLATFRLGGKRRGMLESPVDEAPVPEGSQCEMDPATGRRNCE